jgi:hypothetical protein
LFDIFCKSCFTAYQKFLIPKKILFPKSYHYRSKLTKDVINGMNDLVASYKKKFNSLNNKLVIDIGCNDGSLLDIFKKNKCKTVGVEPTNAFYDIKKKHFAFNEYFSVNLAKKIKNTFGFPDIITFTNVFAHIENLQLVIESLNYLIGVDTIIVIENHYLGSILEKNQFDTFYHEHPRTYSAKSFEFVVKSLNARINKINFTERYGGNIQVYISRNRTAIESSCLNEIFESEMLFLEKFKQMEKSISIWKNKTLTLINNLNNTYGALPAKAFPGRAAILIKLLNINEKQIFAVFEKPGSQKIGNYVPGTRIPIKSDSDLTKINTNLPIINLSWHISEEISKYLSEINYSGKIFNIIDSDSFI